MPKNLGRNIPHVFRNEFGTVRERFKERDGYNYEITRNCKKS